MLALEKQRGAQQTTTTRDRRGPLGTRNPPCGQMPGHRHHHPPLQAAIAQRCVQPQKEVSTLDWKIGHFLCTGFVGRMIPCLYKNFVSFC